MRAEEDLDELEGDVAEVEGHEDENGYASAPVTVGEEGDDEAGEEKDEDDAGDAEDGDAEESRNGGGDRKGRGRGRNGRKGRGRGRRGDDEDGESRMSLRRRYTIQDVIRRRQVLLVQVDTAERGNTGERKSVV